MGKNNAEVGFSLPKTKGYIEKRLREMVYTPKPCGKAGIVAEIGDTTKGCFLLRADMDGLPICEKSRVGFACKNGNMHAWQLVLARLALLASKAKNPDLGAMRCCALVKPFFAPIPFFMHTI
jgi:hypothetical protein